MAYLYRHIRLDKNEVFYVGIGVRHRAYQKTTRNRYWHSIVAKTPYEVEIILDNLTDEEAAKKEIEFIALYGRRNLKKGTLVNLTDGGDGMIGYVATEESRKKISNSKKGKPGKNYNIITDEFRKQMSILSTGNKYCVGRVLSDATKEKLRKAGIAQQQKEQTGKPVGYYNKDGELIARYDSVKQAARLTNNFPQTIMGSCRRTSHYGNYWKLINA